MNYSYLDLKNVVNLLKSEIVGGFFSNISVINSRDILLTFSNNRKEKFLISLSHQCPFMSFVDINESIPTIIGAFNDSLRKYVRDAQLKDIKILNEDRIVELTLIKSNDYFDKETHYLILEMIPHRSNLIILNEDRIIEYAMHTTTLEVSHPIIKGIIYQLTPKNVDFKNSSISHSLDEIKSMAVSYLNEAKNNRLKEKYYVLIKHFKSRLKSLNNKEKIILEEINKAKNNLIYQEHGNALLSLQNYKEEFDQYLKDHNLTINKELSIGQNANIYFKKYKKAKRTIEMDNIELEKTYKEKEDIEIILNNIPFMNDDDLFELAEIYLPHKFKSINKKKKTSFSYVIVDNIKIYFGKNSKQNEELTFSKADKNHYFLHIKDYSGAHIIIASDNPTNHVKQIASEIALILSNKQAGEVQYSQVKNVKKGSFTGQVIFKNYETFVIKKIDEKTIDLLRNYQQ